MFRNRNCKWGIFYCDPECYKRYERFIFNKKFFPELTNKWKLFTGAQPHKFLESLNIKFDFLLLDTAHLMPGEAINFIEVLPFLEENAIVVLHDITYHLLSEEIYGLKVKKSYFSNIYLMTSLFGEKIILENKTKVLENIGAIKLYPNQKRFYLNYFLLLLSPWEYIPEKKHIDELKLFIKKYYKKDIYINLFNKAVEENKNMIEIRKWAFYHLLYQVKFYLYIY